jgi:peptide/nickel transport system substrate-binding protein
MIGGRLNRRQALLGVAAGLATGAPPTSGAETTSRADTRRSGSSTLTAVLESEVVIVDPHVTTASISRTFGYHLFDTLFSMDSKGEIHPQMVDSFRTSADRLTWDFTLRSGLAFHDGAPVTAADCVASLRRWAPLDSLGRMLLAATETMTPKDANSFSIALKRPFPLMLDVLGKPNAAVPFIMPERIIPAGRGERIKELIGSGPFVFDAARWRTGDTMVLTRNAHYVPRAEPADFVSGGKKVLIDELVLKTIHDDSTSASALIAGEIDYLQYLPFDWLGKLEADSDLSIMTLSGVDMFQGNFRLNHASGPFADPDVRRVLWQLVDQNEIMQAIGIPDRYRVKTCPSFWMCGTPLQTDAGSEIARFSVDGARKALAATHYHGEPVVMLQVAGSISQTAGDVLADHMKNAGFNVQPELMDWGTVLARRAKREGWSLFPVYSNGIDMEDPLTHFYVANNCADYPGWSCDAGMTRLLEDFANASDTAARRTIAAQIQIAAYQLTPSVMWGQFARPAGYRTRLKDMISSSFPMFWQVST